MSCKIKNFLKQKIQQKLKLVGFKYFLTLILNIFEKARCSTPQLWSYPELEFISCFGCHGEAPGELQFPYGLCVDEDLLYVADCKNHRIQVQLPYKL